LLPRGWSSPRGWWPPDGLIRRLGFLLRRVPEGDEGIAWVRARFIYILPTRSGLVYAAVTFTMLLGSLNYQNNLGLLVTFFLVAVGLVAMHHCWFNLLGLGVRARGGPPVFAGETARFEITLCNLRRGPRYDLGLPAPGRPSQGVPVAGGDQHDLPRMVETVRRGRLALPEVEVETRYPMGLFRAWCVVSCRAEVLVYPRPAPRPGLPPAAGGSGHQASGRSGEGVDDFLGARAYRPGDPVRHLDWKAWARERGLLVKEFGGAAGDEAWADWEAVPGDTEGRISMLTRQVIDCAESGVRFGLRVPGTRVPLGRGDAHMHRCLGILAGFGHEGTG
jgi:uncharacterized protein (DUF58 family)